MISEISVRQWQTKLSQKVQQQAVVNLEQGLTLYTPNLAFSLSPEEHKFLTPTLLSSNVKNVSYHPQSKKLGGIYQSKSSPSYYHLKSMMARYAQSTYALLNNLLPNYKNYLGMGRTSFRPANIMGRETTPRKDDTRLHVDAFPSMPVQGWRILRVFSNVNPQGQVRQWRLGEPFHQVVERFLPQLKRPFPGSAYILKWLKMTKQYRTAYDHYMLQLHNLMKFDDDYQQSAQQVQFGFPAGSTWIVFTDQVSHAAMSGQFAFEQTFYVPIEAMLEYQKAPLFILEKYLQRKLCVPKFLSGLTI